jgi:hypothetical protein
LTHSEDLGPVYTTGGSFRARAEARQREYRARILRVGWSRHGHWLDDVASAEGRNFVVPEAFEEAQRRADGGKGVDKKRTLPNMLSSQAMCFNVFSPLARDIDLAGEVLRPFFSTLAEVRAITFEYTPPPSLFGDQSGTAGLDCDLLVEANLSDGSKTVIAIETKFVEPGFSTCGFRKPGRRAKGLAVCPDEIPVASDTGLCLYVAQKGYKYWRQAERLATLGPHALPETGCPFGGPEWQLWVNHTLAHAEADARHAQQALFVVCAPAANVALRRNGVLDKFQARLANPDTFRFLPLDDLVGQIGSLALKRPALKVWADGIAARYVGI